MSTPTPKLYGAKQILIISCSMAAGVLFFLFRRYHENGRLTSIDAVCTGITIIVSAIIAVVIVRKGNRKE